MLKKIAFKNWKSRTLSEFCKSNNGSIAVEFAFILPILVIMYFSTVVFVSAIEAKHKLRKVSEAIGDLTARSVSVTPSDITNILNAGKLLISPFKSDQLEINYGSMVKLKDNTIVQCWAYRATFPSGSTTISSTTLPTLTALGLGNNLLDGGKSVIVVKATYKYIPFINYGPTNINLTEIYYSRPRQSDEVGIVLSGSAVTTCYK